MIFTLHVWYLAFYFSFIHLQNGPNLTNRISYTQVEILRNFTEVLTKVFFTYKWRSIRIEVDSRVLYD